MLQEVTEATKQGNQMKWFNTGTDQRSASWHDINMTSSKCGPQAGTGCAITRNNASELMNVVSYADSSNNNTLDINPIFVSLLQNKHIQREPLLFWRTNQTACHMSRNSFFFQNVPEVSEGNICSIVLHHHQPVRRAYWCLWMCQTPVSGSSTWTGFVNWHGRLFAYSHSCSVSVMLVILHRFNTVSHWNMCITYQTLKHWAQQ